MGKKKRIRSTALALSVILLAGSFTACTKKEVPEEPEPAQSAMETVEEGKGEGTAPGYVGPITVTLKVKDGKVVEAGASGEETPDIGGKAIDTMTQAMISSGSIHVDSVSGATATSTAVLAAAKDAYAQATGTAVASQVKMEPGTYTAEATGFALAEKLKVSVIVTQDSIQSIQVDMDNGETKPILQSVADLMVPRMVEHQSLAVDSITGATGSSNGVRLAVTDAVTQALEKGGSDPAAISAFMTPPPKVTNVQETIETKVLVVGMGGSGTAAAVRAAETMHAADPNNVQVLAIDKAGKYGGTAANTQEMMAINPPKFQAEHNNGQNYVDVPVMKKAWLNHTEGDEKTAFVDLMMSSSGEMLDWLVYDHGYDMSTPQKGFTDADVYLCKYQYMPNNTAGNKDVIGTYYDRMYKDYTDLGGQYMLETEAFELIYNKDSNEVKGVKARKYDGTQYEILADSVILATGGFGANGDMQEKYLSDQYYPLKGKWKLFGMQQNDGKMLQSALDIGAATYNIGISPMVHMAAPPVFLSGFQLHKPEGEIAFFTNRQAVWSAADLPLALTTAPDMLLVGRDGKRFANEADMFIWWKAGPSYFSILSESKIQDIQNKGLHFTTAGASSVYVGHQTAVPVNTPLPETQEVIKAGMDAGYIVKADTLEDLAKAMGVDAAALAKTVANYNSYCQSGVDSEFSKTADFLETIGDGPYYAVQGYSYAFSTCGGIDIDENFNVLLADGQKPVKGLYAVGTDSMGVLFTEKRDYVTFGGAAQGWAYTSGYFAGSNAATHAMEGK